MESSYRFIQGESPLLISMPHPSRRIPDTLLKRMTPAMIAPSGRQNGLAVIGDGRWGRILCRCVARKKPGNWPLFWVARHHTATEVPGRFSIVREIGDISPPPAGAIVANAPASHAATTRQLLDRKIHTLVEKPFVTDNDDASALIALANNKKTILAVGHVMRFADYLIDAARNLPAPIKRVRIHWEDAEFDTRQGETKTASVHVSPILDVFPHIWSIIRTVGVIPPLKFSGIHIDSNSGAVTVDLTDDAAHVSTSYSATINRQGTARKRIVEILCWDGSVNEIDFSVEPGTVTLDGTSFAALWDPGNPPLDQEIETFLQALTGADLDERIDAGKSAECFELTALAETQFEKTETELIIESLRASVHMGLAARLTGEKLLREAAKNRIRLDIGGPDAKKLGQAIFNDISGIGNPVTINGSEAWAFYRDSTLKSSLQAGLNGAEPKIRDHETKDRIS